MTFDYKDTQINNEYTENFVLEEQLVNEYKEVVGYGPQDDFVPNSIFAIYKIWNLTLGKPPVGTIHLKQRIEYYKTPKINDVFQVKVIIKDKYEKKNRDYLVFETIFLKEDNIYCKETTTYLWGFAKGD